jgi:hypothetical protein
MFIYMYIYITELYQHKLWFDEECLAFLVQTKQA